MKKQLKAAVIGCGRIASRFAEDKGRKFISTHAEGYLANSRIDLVAACDTNEENLKRFGKRWGIKKLYTDAMTMFKSEPLDIVSVCTWNNTHASLVQAAAKHGVKSIICEKPISDSLQSAESMIKTCQKSNSTLLINYARRYMKLFANLQRNIQQDKLGEIQAVSCYYTAGVLNTGTHLFDFLRMLFGDVEWVWSDADSVTDQPDPNISGYLRFKSGFGCTIQALESKHYLMFEADIYGTKQRIRIVDSGSRALAWKAMKHPVFAGYKALKEIKGMHGSFGEGIPGLINDAVEAIEKKIEVKCSGVDGLKSLEIAQALIQSSKEKKRIQLPLKNKKIVMTSK